MYIFFFWQEQKKNAKTRFCSYEKNNLFEGRQLQNVVFLSRKEIKMLCIYFPYTFTVNKMKNKFAPNNFGKYKFITVPIYNCLSNWKAWFSTVCSHIYIYVHIFTHFDWFALFLPYTELPYFGITTFYCMKLSVNFVSSYKWYWKTQRMTSYFIDLENWLFFNLKNIPS